MGVPIQQNPHEVLQLVRGLESAKGNRRGSGKQKFSCKKNTYSVEGTNGIYVDSWKFNDWDYHKPDLPTYARGLFTTKRSDNNIEIAIRGYDKFFNVGEVRETEWPNIERDTIGPYELSVKENGCIIFISGLEDGTLLVCSKHSTGAREDATKSHAINGEKWIETHLNSVGKTKQDLAFFLRQNNITAVGELCDDAFEEHVLAYPPEAAGLYIHGINLNLPDFATWSGPDVHQFAALWGFKKAEYTMIQSIEEVKSFLEQCAETGSWNGRETEGFVVRSYRKGSAGQPTSNWFFKYKFEEPYLMYRQWRECTKSVIAGKPPKIRKHRKVTEEYLLYARRQLAKTPKLGKLYNQNHGIIAMRDGFLAEKGVRGADLIAAEAEEEGTNEGDSIRNVVLVPIATIGCGKTTVATALAKLFGFGHVQNDNIQGSKNRAGRFALQITTNMVDHAAVIADRNNHQRRERAQIMDDVKKVVPEARFVALHYVHEPKDKMADAIRKITAKRVLERGDNHQTIRAGTKSEQEILGIMDGFLQRFEGINTRHDPDANFDEIINLDVAASSRDNLETVINHLYDAFPRLFTEEMPTHQDMDDAIAFAMQSQVEVQHDLSFGTKGSVPKDKRTGGKVAVAVSPMARSFDWMEKHVEYFCVNISGTVITSLLSKMFADASPEQAAMYHALRRDGRIQNSFHVTLIHKSMAEQGENVWGIYLSALEDAIEQGFKANKDGGMPTLGAAEVQLEHLVWDGRVMAFAGHILPNQHNKKWPCANAVPHITVGTAEPSIKPKESNDMFTRWRRSNRPEEFLEPPEDGPVQWRMVDGRKIWRMEVPNERIIQGAIKPVMYR